MLTFRSTRCRGRRIRGLGAVDAAGNYTWVTGLKPMVQGTYTVVLRVTDDGITQPVRHRVSFDITVPRIQPWIRFSDPDW